VCGSIKAIPGRWLGMCAYIIGFNELRYWVCQREYLGMGLSRASYWEFYGVMETAKAPSSE
jgi:hypothetical protein